VDSELCPSDQVLAAFILGDLPEEVLDSIREHQERCARCELRASQLDDEVDPVIDTIRRTVSRQRDTARESGLDVSSDDSDMRTDSPGPEGSWIAAGGPEQTSPPHETVLPAGERGTTARERVNIAQPVLPDYEIGESLLGRGGMGVVYKARHRKLNRLVALKMIAGSSNRASELFQIEAKAVARLQHPNIVQIFDIGNSDGQPFLALEFVEGGSLDQRIAGQAQPARFAAEMVRTLARAADYAHRQGIVHCDLKPSNILITPEGIPKIADFGVARWTESENQWGADGDIVGTPCYMAPEQARGQVQNVGPATDVYSLGVILYEMLTGRPPHCASTSTETLSLVCEQDPIPPRQIQPRLPRDLETVVLKSLRKEPFRRYADARSLAEDLDRFLTGEPILARRISRIERSYLWVRRHRASLSLVTVITAFWLVILGLVHHRYSTVVNWYYSKPVIESRPAPEPRPVTPAKTIIQADGSIRLGAASAAIHGDSLIFEAPFGNLGYWHSVNDRAVWTFQVYKSATFTLSMDYACFDGNAGNRYDVAIDDALFKAVVAGTGSYLNYRVIAIGELKLEAGTHHLEVRPGGPLNGALFDLRAVTLVPR
jgi:eukaryotic-like serine/threonine-protein kinase